MNILSNTKPYNPTQTIMKQHITLKQWEELGELNFDVKKINAQLAIGEEKRLDQ